MTSRTTLSSTPTLYSQWMRSGRFIFLDTTLHRIKIVLHFLISYNSHHKYQLQTYYQWFIYYVKGYAVFISLHVM